MDYATLTDYKLANLQLKGDAQAGEELERRRQAKEDMRRERLQAREDERKRQRESKQADKEAERQSKGRRKILAEEIENIDDGVAKQMRRDLFKNAEEVDKGISVPIPTHMLKPKKN